MHFRIPLLLEALWVCGISVSAAAAGSTESNPTPSKDFGRFAQDVGLPASQISCLAGKYAAALTDSALLDLACLTARVILGEEQVESEVVNQTVVDVNWYVPTFFPPVSFPRANAYLTIGQRLAGLSHTASSSRGMRLMFLLPCKSSASSRASSLFGAVGTRPTQVGRAWTTQASWLIFSDSTRSCCQATDLLLA